MLMDAAVQLLNQTVVIQRTYRGYMGRVTSYERNIERNHALAAAAKLKIALTFQVRADECL